MEGEVLPKLLEAAVKDGLWAVLFTALLWWVLRDTKTREDRYYTIISTLSDEVLKQLGEIRELINRKRGSDDGKDHRD